MGQRKKQAAVVCCSNGMAAGQRENLENLERCLNDLGIEIQWSAHIYGDENGFSASAEKRAEALMEFYRTEEIDHIFDISGGDLANEMLPFLDYEEIQRSDKIFWGYSDLTTVLNAVYAKCGKPSVLYQVRNLLYPEQEIHKENFMQIIEGKNSKLFEIGYEFLRGSQMSGVLVGGNIRCLLKLAGTPYWPEMKGKILLLEAYSGNAARITAYISQLEQMGVFEQVNGVLLGTFTELERNPGMPHAKELLLKQVGESLPVATTKDIGHGRDSKGIVIGKHLTLKVKY